MHCVKKRMLFYEGGRDVEGTGVMPRKMSWRGFRGRERTKEVLRRFIREGFYVVLR